MNKDVYIIIIIIIIIEIVPEVRDKMKAVQILVQTIPGYVRRLLFSCVYVYIVCYLLCTLS